MSEAAFFEIADSELNRCVTAVLPVGFDGGQLRVGGEGVVPRAVQIWAWCPVIRVRRTTSRRGSAGPLMSVSAAWAAPLSVYSIDSQDSSGIASIAFLTLG